MYKDTNHYEQGQNLLIFAVIMVVFVALAALVVDGGFAYTRRREAQNAADAGALAGAEALCSGDPYSTIEAQALDYAINRNGATGAVVDIDEKSITVTTTLPHDTFLAGIIGSDIVTTTAIASAGCYVPCDGTGVLPVAWACQPPAGELISDTCGIEYSPLTDPDPTLYIIMDTKKTGEDMLCLEDPPYGTTPTGALDCDLNDDGVNELMTGGNRSWLNLDGGPGGNSELVDWMGPEGFDGQLHLHYWYGGTGGDKVASFHAAYDLVGTIVYLPVYDAYCNDGEPESSCPEKYHPQDVTVLASGYDLYYHVFSFSGFEVTCVWTKNSDSCPGRDNALAINSSIPKNVKTIEGFFVEGYDPNLSGKCEGPYNGLFTMYLNR